MNLSPYEAIVVGSGATGGVAALTLAEKGIKVLVIEAGPNLNANQALGSEPINTINRIGGIINGTHRKQAQHPGYWKNNPKLYLNETENPYLHPPQKPFLLTQGRQVGGRSLTWGGITLRLSDYEFKASKTDGFGPLWPIGYSELAPYYTEIERKLRIYGHKDYLEELPDGEYIDFLPFTKSELDFSNRIKNNLDLQIIHSRGFGPHKKEKDGEWPLFSSQGNTLKSALKTGNVQILENHIVERLIISKSRNIAEGIMAINRLNGNRIKLTSKLIVLCASTIPTIRILLNSESNNIENGFIDPSGNLGSYIMDHVSLSRFFTFPKDTIDSSGKSYSKKSLLSGAGSFFIPFGNNLNSLNKKNFLRGYGLWGAIDRFEPPNYLKKYPNTKTGFLIGHGEVLPIKENKVFLSDKIDKWGMKIPFIDFCWRDNEIEMTKHMAKTIKTIVDSAGGEILPIEEIINIPFLQYLSHEAVALSNKVAPPGYYIHEMGGAAMGTNENNSVVDKWNRLWRCKNVLVVDGSCWPTSGWQSPTLTMMALTRRACVNAIQNRVE